METAVLELRELTVELDHDGAPRRVLDRVSLSLRRGEALGLVGESGCGKSMTALSILRLLPPAARVTGGQVLFQGQDLLSLDRRGLRAIRGSKIAIVFQEPMTALNPVLTVGEQIAEVIRLQRRVSAAQARSSTEELLARVGISSPAERYRAYPHELSGGTRQRVLLAMALAGEPSVLLADEPTSALDVTLQAQVLGLIGDARRRSGMAVLLITHDLSLVQGSCDRVAVLYAGELCEAGTTPAVLSGPRHPYTAGLLSIARALSQRPRSAVRAALPEIPGSSSGPGREQGCRFAPRCARAARECGETHPELAPDGPGHQYRCLRPLPAGSLA